MLSLYGPTPPHALPFPLQRRVSPEEDSQLTTTASAGEVMTPPGHPKRRTGRYSLDAERQPMSRMDVVCRICEAMVPMVLISDHSRVCALVESGVQGQSKDR